MTIETVVGPINRESLSMIGWKHSTPVAAQLAAQDAIAEGYVRVVIQKVGAQRLQEGRSMDEDDHWVAAPGHEYFVWGDSATHEAKHIAARKEIDAKHAIENEKKQKRFAELLSQFEATDYPHFIMTGTRFLEDMAYKGFGDLANAAVAARKIEELREVVSIRNAQRGK